MSYCGSGVDEFAVFTNLAALPILYKYTELALGLGCIYGNRGAALICLAGYEVGICACRNVAESGAAVDAHQCVAVFICAFESEAAVCRAAVESVLAFAECRYCRTDLVEATDVLGQVGVEGLCHVAAGGVCAEVGGCYGAFEVSAEVCASRFLKSQHRAFVDCLAFLEFHFGTVIYTGDTAEGEHQREVLGPLRSAAAEAYAVVRAGAVVVRVYIYHVPRSVVVVLVA